MLFVKLDQLTWKQEADGVQEVHAALLHQDTGSDGSRVRALTVRELNMASASESAQPAAAEGPPPKLSDLLDSGWKLYEELEKSNEPTNSDSVQIRIKREIKQLQEATRMVTQLDLFR